MHKKTIFILLALLFFYSKNGISQVNSKKLVNLHFECSAYLRWISECKIKKVAYIQSEKERVKITNSIFSGLRLSELLEMEAVLHLSLILMKELKNDSAYDVFQKKEIIYNMIMDRANYNCSNSYINYDKYNQLCKEISIDFYNTISNRKSDISKSEEKNVLNLLYRYIDGFFNEGFRNIKKGESKALNSPKK